MNLVLKNGEFLNEIMRSFQYQIVGSTSRLMKIQLWFTRAEDTVGRMRWDTDWAVRERVNFMVGRTIGVHQRREFNFHSHRGLETQDHRIHSSSGNEIDSFIYCTACWYDVHWSLCKVDVGWDMTNNNIKCNSHTVVYSNETQSHFTISNLKFGATTTSTTKTNCLSVPAGSLLFVSGWFWKKGAR